MNKRKSDISSHEIVLFLARKAIESLILIIAHQNRKEFKLAPRISRLKGSIYMHHKTHTNTQRAA